MVYRVQHGIQYVHREGKRQGEVEVFQGEYLLSWWEYWIVSEPLGKTCLLLSLHLHS